MDSTKCRGVAHCILLLLLVYSDALTVHPSDWNYRTSTTDISQTNLPTVDSAREMDTDILRSTDSNGISTLIGKQSVVSTAVIHTTEKLLSTTDLIHTTEKLLSTTDSSLMTDTHSSESLLSVADSNLVTDTHSTESLLSTADSSLVTDTQSTESLLSIADSSLVTDTHSMESLLSTADSSLLTDTHSTESLLSTADSSLVTDTRSTESLLSTADSSLVTDTHSTESLLSTADSILVTDTHSTESLLSTADSSLATDTHSTEALLSTADSSLLTDTQSTESLLSTSLLTDTQSTEFLLSTADSSLVTDTQSTESLLSTADSSLVTDTHSTESLLTTADSSLLTDTHSTESLLTTADSSPVTDTHNTESLLYIADVSLVRDTHSTDSLLSTGDSSLVTDAQRTQTLPIPPDSRQVPDSQEQQVLPSSESTPMPVTFSASPVLSTGESSAGSAINTTSTTQATLISQPSQQTTYAHQVFEETTASQQLSTSVSTDQRTQSLVTSTSGSGSNNTTLSWPDIPATVLAPSPAFCRRLYLDGFVPEHVVWIQFGGIYYLEEFLHEGFPVYRHDGGNLTLFYTGEYLVIGNVETDTYLGAGATVHSSNSTTLVHLIQPGRYPFSHVINRWFNYHYSNQSNYYLVGSPITTVCVDDDDDYLQTCTGGQLYMNTTVKPHLGPAISNSYNYFEEIPNMIINYRPVYRLKPVQESQSFFLFYASQRRWVVDSYPKSSRPLSQRTSLLYAEDDAIRPEYILAHWNVKVGKQKWKQLHGVVIKCKGLPGPKACQSHKPCFNGGFCRKNDLNETVCKCPSAYRGKDCSKSSEVCDPPTFDYIFSDGKVATTVCVNGSEGQLVVSFCHSRPSGSLSWVNYSGCLTPHEADRLSLMDNFARQLDARAGLVLAIVIFSSLLLQLLTPIFIWYGLNRKPSVQSDSSDPDQLLEAMQKVQDELEQFTLRHPEPEAEYTADVHDELLELHQRHENAVDELELARRMTAKSVGLCRINSCYYYISMWFWLIFVLICEVSGLAMVSNTAHILVITAIVIIVYLYLVILIECCGCKERQYLKNVSPWKHTQEYLQKIKNCQPEVWFTVECYHFETRTSVTVVKDEKENPTPSISTYEERVVTFTATEPAYFSFWTDTSDPEVNYVPTNAITKVHVLTNVVSGDRTTDGAIDLQYQRFIERHKNRDAYCDYAIEKNVPDVIERMLVARDPLPCWMTNKGFWALALLFMTWPHRLIINRNTCRRHYVLSKRIYISRPRDSQTLADDLVPFDAAEAVMKSGSVVLGVGQRPVSIPTGSRYYTQPSLPGNVPRLGVFVIDEKTESDDQSTVAMTSRQSSMNLSFGCSDNERETGIGNVELAERDANMSDCHDYLMDMTAL